MCWTLPGCRGEEGSTDLDTVTRVTTTTTRSPGDPPLPAAHVDDLGPGAALQLRVDCRGPGALLGVDGVRVLLGLAVHRPRPRQPRQPRPGPGVHLGPAPAHLLPAVTGGHFVNFHHRFADFAITEKAPTRVIKDGQFG